jgi:hypothetical protein
MLMYKSIHYVVVILVVFYAIFYFFKVTSYKSTIFKHKQRLIYTFKADTYVKKIMFSVILWLILSPFL